MKQRIRKIWLALCMAVCLFALAGCSAAVDTAETIDPQIEMAMQSGSQQYLDLFNQMDDASIEQALATSVKNKDTVMENALKSWDSVKDDLGAFVSSETAVVTKSDDGYVARMNTVYEKRNMEFTLIADEDLNKVETISFSPVYTTGEKMAKAGMNTLMGMGVVFVVLIFISWLISMFKYISVFEAKMKAKKAAAAPAPAAAPQPAETAPPATEPPAAAAPAVTFPLDLNQATAAELEQIPGMQPELAEKIVAFRQQIQAFSSVYELLYVDGMTEAYFVQLRDYVQITEELAQ